MTGVAWRCLSIEKMAEGGWLWLVSSWRTRSNELQYTSRDQILWQSEVIQMTTFRTTSMEKSSETDTRGVGLLVHMVYIKCINIWCHSDQENPLKNSQCQQDSSWRNSQIREVSGGLQDLSGCIKASQWTACEKHCTSTRCWAWRLKILWGTKYHHSTTVNASCRRKWQHLAYFIYHLWTMNLQEHIG